MNSGSGSAPKSSTCLYGLQIAALSCSNLTVKCSSLVEPNSWDLQALNFISADINQSQRSQVYVEEADILRWPVEERLRPFLSPGQRAKCVANLPYNITTSALKKLLPLGSLFSSCTLMLQEEAAERLVNASPGDSEYRAMSFFVNFYAEPRISFRVDKSAFTPQPKCDSAVVVMGMRRPEECPEVTSAKAFFSLVRGLVRFGAVVADLLSGLDWHTVSPPSNSVVQTL